LNSEYSPLIKTLHILKIQENSIDRPEVALNQGFKPSQLQGRVGRKECIMKKSGRAA